MNLPIKKLLFLLCIALALSSCTTIYYSEPNPGDGVSAEFPKDWYGNYTLGDEEYVRIFDKGMAYRFNSGGTIYDYNGPYGSGTPYSLYKVDGQYLMAVKDLTEEELSSKIQYRIYAIHVLGGALTLSEFGDEDGKTAHERAKKMKNMTYEGNDTGDDLHTYLFTPTPSQFKEVLNSEAFRTVRTLYKKE